MARARIAVTLDEDLLARIDDLVRAEHFSSRSQAVQTAVREMLEGMRTSRLAGECAKLDPAFERAMAEEGLSGETREWPAY